MIIVGRGPAVYNEKILPLFEEAKILVCSIHTESANEAKDHIMTEDLTKYDGLICVGGDGMFAELCHGLLLRTIKEANLNIDDPNVTLVQPKLRIGVIPAGSTDAVVFGTTGFNDPVTSALQIIVGESLPIDISTVSVVFSFIDNSLRLTFFLRFTMKMDLFVLWLRCLLTDFLVTSFVNQMNGDV